MFGSKKPSALDENPDGTPRSFWDKLLATTPVLMTVVATVLAGMSNSEMTKAQYHRSLAAQTQAKVGDQWAFFQFKRARGTSQDLTAKLLAALTPGADLDAESLRNQAERLVRGFRAGASRAEQFVAEVKSAQPTLLPAAERLQSEAQQKVSRAAQWKDALNSALSERDVEMALAALNTAGTTKTSGEPKTIDDPTIRQLLHDIADRKTEAETFTAMPTVDEKRLQEAIRTVESQARAEDEAGKPLAKNLDRLEQLLTEEVKLARSWDRNVGAFRAALEDLPNPDGKIRPTFAALAAQATALRQAAQETGTAFTSARLRLDERRYQHEADDNRLTAGLYEIQVRKAGWQSERHRLRSAYFFYGMLAAQAGVTIASLALAVRMRSVLWSLASVAGTVAVMIGAYVYLYI